MKKTVYIIPGFTESLSDPQYKWLCKEYKNRGYIVKEPTIKWKYRVMSDYVQQFTEYFQQHKTEQNHIVGFSFGAMIALIFATILKPSSLSLYSLSPYFKEDLEYVKPSWKADMGKRRMNDFQYYEATNIAKKITGPTKIFYGTVEGKKFPRLKFRCEETARNIKDAKLIAVKDAPHKIDHPAYVEAIKNQLE